MADHALQADIKSITGFAGTHQASTGDKLSDFDALADHLQPIGYVERSNHTKNQPRRVLEVLAFVIFVGALMEIPGLMNSSWTPTQPVSSLRLHCQIVQPSLLSPQSGTVATQRCFWATHP